MQFTVHCVRACVRIPVCVYVCTYIIIYVCCQFRKGCPGEIYYNIYIYIYQSRGYCNICVNTKVILSFMLIACSISEKLKPVCSIYCTQCRDHIWRMICVGEWFIKDYFIKGGIRYKEIASQLFVCPKTVYRTTTFLIAV